MKEPKQRTIAFAVRVTEQDFATLIHIALHVGQQGLTANHTAGVGLKMLCKYARDKGIVDPGVELTQHLLKRAVGDVSGINETLDAKIEERRRFEELDKMFLAMDDEKAQVHPDFDEYIKLLQRHKR